LHGPIPTYYSPGSRERAEQLQAWLRAADAFFQDRWKIAPPFSLAVLNEEHWAQISPAPDGIPFYTFEEPTFVVMPALPERSVVNQIYGAAHVGLPAGAAADLERVGVSYEDAVGQIVDLIGFHEVGHVYIALLGTAGKLAGGRGGGRGGYSARIQQSVALVRHPLRRSPVGRSATAAHG
jgi:hypothetical protein